MTAAGDEALPPQRAQPGSLWRNQDFLRLWVGQTVSRVGSEVSLVAIPFTAVVVLGVDAFQAGLLGTMEFLPFLLVGLPAGAVVDRMRRRRILIAADAGRALALGSVPLAAMTGHLSLLQLYAVALIAGVLTVFFDVAYQSYLPSLVEAGALVDGNSKLELSNSAAALSGPSIGGALVTLLGAPRAIAADAASYVWSVAFLLLIRRREPEVARSTVPRDQRTALRTEIAEGLRYVLGHRLLRPIAFCTGSWNLFGHIGFPVFVLFAVRDLGLGAGAVGVIFSVGAVGNLLGAAVCSRITGRIGIGRAVLYSQALTPSAFLIPLAVHDTAIPLLIAAGVLSTFSGTIYNINQVSLRQGITPRRLMGRLNATMRFIVWGTIPIGSLIGGILGTVIGLRATLVVSAAGQSLVFLWILLSPVPRVQRIEDHLHPERVAELAAQARGAGTVDGGVPALPAGLGEEAALPSARA